MKGKTVICQRCGAENSPDALNCSLCQGAMTWSPPKVGADTEKRYTHHKSPQEMSRARRTNVGCLVVGLLGGIVVTWLVWSWSEGVFRYIVTGVIALSWLGLVAQYAGKVRTPGPEEDVLVLSDLTIDYNGTKLMWNEIDEAKVMDVGASSQLVFYQGRPKRLILAIPEIRHWEAYQEVIAEVGAKIGKPVT